MNRSTENASRLLKNAETAHRNKYGAVGADRSIELAKAWTQLASVQRNVADAEAKLLLHSTCERLVGAHGVEPVQESVRIAVEQILDLFNHPEGK